MYRCAAYTNSPRCSANTIRQDELIRYVIDTIEKKMASPSVVKRLRAELRRQAKEAAGTSSRKAFKAEADRLGRQLAKAKRRLVTVDDDMVKTVQDRIRRLDAQHQAALVRLRVVEKPASQLQAEQDAKVSESPPAKPEASIVNRSKQ